MLLMAKDCMVEATFFSLLFFYYPFWVFYSRVVDGLEPLYEHLFCHGYVVERYLALAEQPSLAMLSSVYSFSE